MRSLSQYSYYKFVPGNEIWDYELYDLVANTCTGNDIIAEIGVGFGRSTCIMTEMLAFYKKTPKFYAIDLFGTVPEPNDGQMPSGNTPWHEPFVQWSNRVGGFNRMIDHFDFYMKSNPSLKYLTDRVQFPPWHSSEEFDDSSVFFAMLNADDSEDGILKQLQKWFPKIKSKGIMGIYCREDKNILRLVKNFCAQNEIDEFKYRSNIASFYKK